MRRSILLCVLVALCATTLVSARVPTGDDLVFDATWQHENPSNHSESQFWDYLDYLDYDPEYPNKVGAAGPCANSVAKANEWLAVGMPYCQVTAVRQPTWDAICNRNCPRSEINPKNPKWRNPAWNAYRSDCSAFVSYAWGVPASQQFTTYSVMNVAKRINCVNMMPGDAILIDGHIAMFERWVSTAAGNRVAQFSEEANCRDNMIRTQTTVVCDGTTVWRYGRAYTAIRHNKCYV